MPDPTLQDLKIDLTKLDGRISTQEEQMQTHKAETATKISEYQLDYHTGWRAVHASMEAMKIRIAERDADQAKRDADHRETAAKRETNHQAAINALSEKMVNREIRLIIALIMIIGLAFTIFRTTLPTPTITLPTATTTTSTAAEPTATPTTLRPQGTQALAIPPASP